MSPADTMTPRILPEELDPFMGQESGEVSPMRPKEGSASGPSPFDEMQAPDPHEMMRDYGDKKALLHGSMISLNPQNPNYLDNLAAHVAHGEVLKNDHEHKMNSLGFGQMNAQTDASGNPMPQYGGPGKPVAQGEAIPEKELPQDEHKFRMQADKDKIAQAEQAGDHQTAGQAKIALADEARMNPWGTPGNHPGVLGKIGHIAGVVGNVAGNALLGPQNMSLIPSTQANLAAKEHGGVAEEELGNKEEAQQKENELHEAQAGQFDMVPYGEPDKDGVQHYVPKKDVARLQEQEMKNTGAVATQEKKNEGAQDVAETHGQTAEQLQKERLASQELIAKGHDLVRGEVARLHEQGATARAKDPNALTNTMKTMKQQAQSTLPGIDRALDETEKVAQELGPAAGRWNDFWQGKVGVANPAYAHYKDEIAFVSSAVTLAHARGRMSNELFQHFQKMFDAGKQSPENMIQALNVAKEWLTEYATMGETPAAPHQAANGPELKPPKEADPGMKWQHKTTNGKTEWRQVKQ